MSKLGKTLTQLDIYVYTCSLLRVLIVMLGNGFTTLVKPRRYVDGKDLKNTIRVEILKLDIS
jgi:hypothetical protein